MTFFNWDVHNHAESLEPVDDVMKRLIGQVRRGNETRPNISPR